MIVLGPETLVASRTDMLFLGLNAIVLFVPATVALLIMARIDRVRFRLSACPCIKVGFGTFGLDSPSRAYWCCSPWRVPFCSEHASGIERLGLGASCRLAPRFWFWLSLR